MKRTVGRPKTSKDRRTLNLSVEMETKRKLFALATQQGLSISALVTQLVNGVHARNNGASVAHRQ